MNPYKLLRFPQSRRCIAALVTVFTALSSHGVEMGGVAIHGSLSTTAAYSPEYNYMGDTKGALDLNQNELILNGTKRFDNGIKLAAQLYAYEFAGYEDMAVDFANIDYSFSQQFGVRVGRNKMPVGFYNEVQDLDQVRVFASLPLNFYPRGLRAISAATDGVAIYGNVSVGKAGSFDYQAFAGVIGTIDEETPFLIGYGATAATINKLYGVAFTWNTPVEGLRLGYSFYQVPKADLDFGPTVTELDVNTHVASIEYTRGKWTATAEYKRQITGLDFVNAPLPSSSNYQDDTYAQLTYQATDKLGLGGYYCYSYFERTKGADKDAAFAASYALQPWWLVKAEVHFMNGINNLGIVGDSNPGASDETWTYFMLKTTLSF